MANSYKFSTNEEKLDEVYSTADGDKLLKSQSEKSIVSSNKLSAISMLIQTLLLILLIVLIGMAGYIIYQIGNINNSCEITSTTSDPVIGSTGAVGTCDINSTQILQTHNATQYMARLLQDIYFRNDTSMIVKLLQDIQSEVENTTDIMALLLQQSEDSLLKLMDIITTLTNHKDTSISTAAVIDDVLLIVEELLRLQNASVLFNSVTPVSCQDIKKALPDSSSGYYHVNSRNIYCNMDELCGSGGGWTRLAYLDMDDSTESCPTGYLLRQSGGFRACGRTNLLSGPYCTQSIKFPSNGIAYSEICGRVIGYQLGSTDAVDVKHVPIIHHNDLNSYYVDGISLTRGNPRQHVWTFMSGLLENYYTVYNCPCNTPPGADQLVQSFVGSHYYCESGESRAHWDGSTMHVSDPLWDGKGCGAQEGDCCSVEGLPWFHRQYVNTTTDYLELRICGDQSHEDTPFALYEIYVK